MGKIGERLHGKDGVEEDAHTHTQVVEDNGGELTERVGTRCGQRDSFLRERRETLCPLEADHDQVGSVVSNEFEGKSAANGCTRSLGGMETPGALVEASESVVPGECVPVCVVESSVPVCAVASVVPVCVVSRCVFTSVFECVLRRTHSGSRRACVRATPCEWCGRECAGVRASQHAVCERGTAGGRGRVCVRNGMCVRTAVWE